MKMTLEKQTDSPARAKQPGTPGESGSRSNRKRGLSARTRDFWRALSDAAQPHTPALRRFHD
jgi:hypothetical protein